MRLLSISAVLNVVFIPAIGIVGAAIATFIAYSVLDILTLIISRRYLKFDLSPTFMLKSVIASVIMLLCIWLFNQLLLARVLISMFAGIMIYFGVLFLMKGLSKSEITFFLNFTRKNLRKIPMVR